jgi:2,3-diketo-5-methylthio-1-phosphopentane phosphatase
LTSRLADRGIGAILLDIEGTTTPIAFVHETLFPYARRRVRAFLAAHEDDLDVRRARDLLVAEHAVDLERDAPPFAPPKSIDALVDYVEWLMDRDRKSPGLKLLQGEIWEQGYRSGELRGVVFDDVPPAIRRWHDAGLRVAVYSSGSELAQRRLFESTAGGDLTPLLSGFFDTRVGAKIESASYARIASAFGVTPSTMLFVSDVTRELAAAREAGLQVVLSLRPGNATQADRTLYDNVASFDELS